jgi:hypothetical protein
LKRNTIINSDALSLRRRVAGEKSICAVPRRRKNTKNVTFQFSLTLPRLQQEKIAAILEASINYHSDRQA